MTRILAILGIIAISGTCLGRERGALEIYGTISKVDLKGEEVVISFKGIGSVYRNDPAFKNRSHPIALYDTEVQLKLDHEEMYKYVRFRYLEWLKKEGAIAHLKELQLWPLFKCESVKTLCEVKYTVFEYSINFEVRFELIGIEVVTPRAQNFGVVKPIPGCDLKLLRF